MYIPLQHTEDSRGGQGHRGCWKAVHRFAPSAVASWDEELGQGVKTCNNMYLDVYMMMYVLCIFATATLQSIMTRVYRLTIGWTLPRGDCMDKVVHPTHNELSNGFANRKFTTLTTNYFWWHFAGRTFAIHIVLLMKMPCGGWRTSVDEPLEVILNERCLQLQDYGSNWPFSKRGPWIVPLHAGASDKKDCKASPQTNLKNKDRLLWLCNCAVCVWVYVCEARIRAPKMGEGCAPDADQRGWTKRPRGCVREGMGYVTIF